MPRPLSTGTAAVDAGRRMRRPYEGGLNIRGGEACLALFRQALLLLMQGDACVAPTKAGSMSVGARHASPLRRNIVPSNRMAVEALRERVDQLALMHSELRSRTRSPFIAR